MVLLKMDSPLADDGWDAERFSQKIEKITFEA